MVHKIKETLAGLMGGVKRGNAFHVSFEIVLLIKAFDAFIEVICGFLLVFINPAETSHFIIGLTAQELNEDPKDMIANALIRLGHSLSVSAMHFWIFYLLSHGFLKLIVVYLLWRKKLWAYPAAVILLCLFVIYQIYKITIAASFTMVFLTILDLIVIMLTLAEYKRQKHSASL